MLELARIQSSLAPVFSHQDPLPNAPQPYWWESTLSTLKDTVTFPHYWLRSKVALSKDELEIFEKLLEGAFMGGAGLLYDLSMGEKKLREVDIACDNLYKILSDKWFPNLEGIHFLRLALLKIQMRVCAVLGEKKKVEGCRDRLLSLGGEIPPHINFQIKILYIASNCIVRLFLRIINLFVKIGLKLVSLFIR